MDAPVVIEARGVEKTFHIPDHRVDTFKERALRPFARRGHRELHALRGVSFDVHQGEFFGIVGRNGSGKSTLLKIMSSIYRADGGSVRIAGRLAPFIELGVGFNPELTSRENVVLNGVMMGLDRREARRRLDAVLDFAELREFSDLPLKNYSSGMMVRLAFAVMVEADADIMLVDEVLAVGDAAFAQKCMDVFRAKREARAHDRARHPRHGDRAEPVRPGDAHPRRRAAATSATPRRRRCATTASTSAGTRTGAGAGCRTSTCAWPTRGSRTRRASGSRTSSRASRSGSAWCSRHGTTSRRRCSASTSSTPTACRCSASTGRWSGEPDRVEAGRRVRISGLIENPLLPGRYSVSCLISRNRTRGDLALHVVRLLDFMVYGTRPGPGSVSVRADIEAEVE